MNTARPSWKETERNRSPVAAAPQPAENPVQLGAPVRA